MGKYDFAYVDLESDDLPPYDPLRFASWYEKPIARWLYWHHGAGGWHQPDYFRCHGCGWIVTWNAINHGGCPCGASHKLSVLRMTVWRKLQLICVPWLARH